MTRKEKLDYARQYVEGLKDTYQSIAAIVLSGSVARGNDLPISDVDLWCFVDDKEIPLPIQKHWEGDLYIDIEQRSASELTRAELMQDSYFCGYMHDALVLFDRSGHAAQCCQRAARSLASPHSRKIQLTNVLEAVTRNQKGLAESARNRNAPEACRTSIFAAWSLCDYMLVAKGISPGGARGIARLQEAWPAASEALISFEGIDTLGPSQIEELIRIYRSIAETGTFFEAWFKKVEWMLANGYQPDALHALWIAFGLRIRGAPDVLKESITTASEHWLKTIGWDWKTVLAKSRELQNLINQFSV